MSGSSVWLRRPLATFSLEVVERILIQLMVVRTCVCVRKTSVHLHSCVCARSPLRSDAARPCAKTTILHLKGGRLLDTLLEPKALVVPFFIPAFPAAGQLLACDSVFLGRRRTQVGNRLAAVIYGDLL